MRALTLPLVLLLLTTPALAADPATTDPATTEAKRHSQAAKKAFSLGLFAEAAEHYKRAYRARPNPSFLFNLGQCYKRLPDQRSLEQSIFFFRSYLQNDPFTTFQKEVEEEIEKLQRRLAELRRPRPVYKRWWFWTLIGAAVTGAAVAVGTSVALRPEDEKPFTGSGSPGLGNTGAP